MKRVKPQKICDCPGLEYMTITRTCFAKIKQPLTGAAEYMPAPEYKIQCPKCHVSKTVIQGSKFKWAMYKIKMFLRFRAFRWILRFAPSSRRLRESGCFEVRGYNESPD